MLIDFRTVSASTPQFPARTGDEARVSACALIVHIYHSRHATTEVYNEYS